MGENLLFGAIISTVVSVLRRVPLINKYPKVTAGILAAVGAFIAQQQLGGSFDWSAFFAALATQLGVAIGTHEVLLSPTSIGSALSGSVKPQDASGDRK